jgi:hypothetical protein
MNEKNGFQAGGQGQMFYLRGENGPGGVKNGDSFGPHLKIVYFYCSKRLKYVALGERNT